MTAFDNVNLGKFAAALLLGVTLVASPAFAAQGGNGGGNSSNNNGGGGNASHSRSEQKGGNSASSQSTAVKATKTEDTADSGSGNSFGNINGFLHASPKALAHASSRSLIGQVKMAYGEKLQSYLDASGTIAEDGSSAAPTAADLQAALQSVANKPVTAELVAAVNEKLIATDTTLAASLQNSGKTVDDLNSEISAGL